MREKELLNIEIKNVNNKPLSSSNFKERMFIKPYIKGREVLKRAAALEQYPKFGNTKITDPGLADTKKLFDSVKKRWSAEIPKPYVDVMKLLSSSSSTISLFQPFDMETSKSLLNFLQNKKDFFEDVAF
mgnify:CR=1 FL=1